MCQEINQHLQKSHTEMKRNNNCKNITAVITAKLSPVVSMSHMRNWRYQVWVMLAVDSAVWDATTKLLVQRGASDQTSSRQIKCNSPTIMPRIACKSTRIMRISREIPSSAAVIMLEFFPRAPTKYVRKKRPKAQVCSVSMASPYVTGRPHSANPNRMK